MALRDELLKDFLDSPLASEPEIKAEFIADLDFLSGETWPNRVWVTREELKEMFPSTALRSE